MMLMCMAGVGVSAMVILSIVAKKLHFPFYALMGAALLLMGAILAVVTSFRGELCKLELHQWKWVYMRGLFGCATYIQILIAVALGAPLGDVSALTSANVVVAALLGRVFLREPLRLLHVIALCCSIVGAVLISKPETLLGIEGQKSSNAWLGYALAIGAGVSSGGLFIAARKSQGISPLILTCSVSTQEGLGLLLLLWSGVVSEAPLDLMQTSSVKLVGVFVALLALVFFSCCTLSMGAQLCPASASSTIYTSTSMLLGYAAQVAIHHETPRTITILGTLLMLSAVVLMSIAKCWYPVANCGSDDARRGDELDSISSQSSSVNETDDGETESLASFVASEFSGVSLHEHTVRKRVTLAMVVPMQTIGIAVA